MEKLVDIKDFVHVSDNSLYIFLALCIFGLLSLVFVAYKIFYMYKKRGKSQRQKAKEILEKLDFKDAKKSAYTISKYALFVAKDDMQKEFLSELNKELLKYKYQKNVPTFSQKDKEKFKTFMDLCDV